MEIKVSIYLDTSNDVRGLVSVYRTGEARPIQTVGSAVVGTNELTVMIQAAVYTLNAVTLNAMRPE